MTYFPLRQTTCFFIPLVAPCKPLLVGEKYNIQMEDIDIISKFTSPKELSLLLSNYKIIELQCDAKTQSHVIACFCNMADSLIQNHSFWMA